MVLMVYIQVVTVISKFMFFREGVLFSINLILYFASAVLQEGYLR